MLKIRSFNTCTQVAVPFWFQGPALCRKNRMTVFRITCSCVSVLTLKLQLKLIYDRQSVGQFVLVPGTHLGPVTNFFSLFEISFRQLLVCYFAAPSLTRGRVCNLLYNCFWALPEQSLLGRSPTEPTAIFYCLIWDCVPSSSPLTTRRDYGGGIVTRLHTGYVLTLLREVKYIYRELRIGAIWVLKLIYYEMVRHLNIPQSPQFSITCEQYFYRKY
jgi:hypothetical protein